MAGDDDLAQQLPATPPPRPGRRDATIAMAMRRFDGADEPAVAPARPAASGWRAHRGQIGALASIVVVALIGIPIALQPPERPLPAPAPVAGPAATPGPVGAEAPRQTSPAPADSASDRTAPTIAQAPVAAGGLPGKVAPSPSSARPVVPPPSPAAEPQPQEQMAAARSATRAEAELVVTGTRVARPSLESPMAVAVVADESFDEGGDIVVTGSQRKRAASRRGDWNACTLLDPARSLRGCGHLIATGRKGDAGIAARHLADGLNQAWQGDLDGAIDRFDKAIALQPRLAIAYLNRGLAHRQRGEADRAAADLDLAIRHAPQSARGYYHRGLLRQSRGDARGARADLARARRLDPQYEEITE